MKKFLAMLLLVCMILTALVACGETTDKQPNSNENSENADASNADKKFEPEIIPAANVDNRQIVVDYMYKMASLEWTPSENIDFTQGENKITDNLYYKKGVKYHGIIYVTGEHTMVDYDEFMTKINENGEYIGAVTRAGAWGNHCSSSIRLSYDLVQDDLTFSSTIGMVPSKKMGTLPLGDYTVEDTFTTTDEIIAANSKDVILEAYSKLQKGDAVLTCWGPTGHARMVVEVNVERNAAGKVNPGRSYVKTIEQTNAFDATRKDGVNTTWYVDHIYTFNDLYEKLYIPLTIEALNIEPKDTTFTTKSLNTESDILEGTLKGIVRSDNVKINGATVQFVNSSGEVVVSEYYENQNNDLQVFQFTNRKIPEEAKSLAAGDYTCYIVAETLYGSAKVAAIEFTVN